MSGEVQHNATSGEDWYFTVRNSSGQVAYLVGQVFETFGTSGRNRDDYDVVLTDKLGDHYTGDFPAWIVSSRISYKLQIFKRITGTPLDSDKVLDQGEIYWDGSQELTEAEAALVISTYGEPSAGAPPVTTSLRVKLGYLYSMFRNKQTSESSPARRTLFADDGTTPLCRAPLSDDGIDFTKDEFTSP